MTNYELVREFPPEKLAEFIWVEKNIPY